MSFDDCKIVDVQFAFNNSEMLARLARRASSLKNGNFRMAKRAESRLTSYKDQYLSYVTAPNTFYVTFQEERDAKRLCSIGEFKLFD